MESKPKFRPELFWDIDIKKPSIKKYRKWYFEIKSGKSFKDICDDETKKCPLGEGHPTGKNKSKECTCYDESTIRKGFDTYESLIWKTPTL